MPKLHERVNDFPRENAQVSLVRCFSARRPQSGIARRKRRVGDGNFPFCVSL